MPDPASQEPLVSVVVPVLDDTEELLARLEGLSPDPACEVVVAAGAPPDTRLAQLAAGRPDLRLVTCPSGRGIQMNAGAAVAAGHWLLFLHADTRLAEGWLAELVRLVDQPQIVGGAFRFALDSAAWQARWLERIVAWRVRRLKLPYGDQAIFVRRSVFVAMGGYALLPLMEDVEFIRRLRKQGALRWSPLAATTSARRWEREGWLRRSARNAGLLMLYGLGVPTARLAGWYDRRN